MTQDMSGIDYKQYLSWEKIVAPSGQVYYKVPGTGLIYDPILSGMKGRPVLFQNPQPQLDEKAKAEKQQQDALDLAKKQASPMGQILPIAGGVAGAVAAPYLINKLTGPSAQSMINTAKGPVVAMSDGSLTGPGAAGFGTQASSAGQAFSQGASAAGGASDLSGATVMATNADGSAVVQLADGSTITTPAGSFEAAAAGGTNATAPMFGAGGTWFNTNGMLGAEGSFAPLNVAGAALGAYGAYNASKAQNKREGITSGAASGAMAGFSVGGPVGAGIGAVVGGLAGAAAHETTKHRSTRRFGELAGTGGGDNFQALVEQGKQESVGGTDTWDIGDDKSKAPIDMMTRSYGVLKTFGPEWANVDQAKRQEIVRQLVDKDLLNSKQGDYLIDNPEQAQQIFHSVVNGTPAGQMANDKVGGSASNTPQVSSSPPPSMHRTYTSSPGIGLNGQPIMDYKVLGKQLAGRMNGRR